MKRDNTGIERTNPLKLGGFLKSSPESFDLFVETLSTKTSQLVLRGGAQLFTFPVSREEAY